MNDMYTTDQRQIYVYILIIYISKTTDENEIIQNKGTKSAYF